MPLSKADKTEIDDIVKKAVKAMLPELIDAVRPKLEALLPELIKAMLPELLKAMLPEPPKIEKQPIATPPSRPTTPSKGPLLFPLDADTKVLQLQARLDAPTHPEFEKKRKHVVLERVPEQPTDDEAYLRDLVTTVTKQPSLGISNEFVKVWRHETKKKIGRNPRIVKVEFKSEVAARKFMLNFRKHAEPKLSGIKPTPFARRDMVPVELTLQAKLRKFVYEINQGCDKPIIFYRDLNVFYTSPT